MSISLKLLSDFTSLFRGNETAHGIHIYENSKESSGKRRGQNFTKSELVTDEMYKDHLNGKKGLGIVPIGQDNTCYFSAIDVDVYNETHEKLVKTIYRYNMPLNPIRSKSGGLHLYIFYAEPVKAIEAIYFMDQFVPLLGLPKTTELFPKQKILNKTQIGSWINLPYYNEKETKQYLFDENYKPVLIETALLKMIDKLQTKDMLAEFFANMPLGDGPPCLQSIFLKGDTQFRNEYLFSLARYYKTKFGDDFEFKIVEANNALDKPIDNERLQKTIINSHRKKDYSYKCSAEPLVSICRKEICKKRRYGIGGDEISELSFEEFIQYKTDPPYYEWKVNGESLKFYSEIDIIQQHKFRELCFRKLHLLPTRLKEINWTAIVNSALQNINIQTIEDSEDISPGTLFKEYVIEFLEKRAMAKTKSQILLDRVYKDDEINAYIFKAKNLVTFLIHQKQFRYFGQTEIQDRLRQLKGQPKRYYVDGDTKSAIRVWILPFEGLKDFVEDEKPIDDFQISFKEEKDDDKESF